MPSPSYIDRYLASHRRSGRIAQPADSMFSTASPSISSVARPIVIRIKNKSDRAISNVVLFKRLGSESNKENNYGNDEAIEITTPLSGINDYEGIVNTVCMTPQTIGMMQVHSNEVGASAQVEQQLIIMAMNAVGYPQSLSASFNPNSDFNTANIRDNHTPFRLDHYTELRYDVMLPNADVTLYLYPTYHSSGAANMSPHPPPPIERSMSKGRTNRTKISSFTNQHLRKAKKI